MSQSKLKVKPNQVAPRYSRWIRKYTEVLTDFKIARLSDAQYRVWDSLLLISGTTPEGFLPSVDEIAYIIRRSAQETQHLVDDLIDKGLVDIIQTDRLGAHLRPHNWIARQFTIDGSALRMRRLRERRRKGAVTNSDVTSDARRDVTSDESASESVSSVSQDTGRNAKSNATEVASQRMVDLDGGRSGTLDRGAGGGERAPGDCGWVGVTSTARRGGGA